MIYFYSCRICQIDKDQADFYIRKETGKIRTECKECYKTKTREQNKMYKKTKKYKKWKKEYDSMYHKNSSHYQKYMKDYSKTEKYKEISHSWHLSNYWPGLTSKEAKAKYNEMLQKQNGVCEICQEPEVRKHNGKPRKLSVDHCHKTGNVRGLLCSRCNLLLGRVKDSSVILQRAVNYLRSFL